MAALSLFYSYAHEDNALLDQLEKHLRQLQRQGLISAWHDGKILPGETWTREIEQHMETASIILLLVSPDFLASDHCYNIQMQRALERHKLGLVHVIPIILRACDWQHSPLKDLQCLPRDGKPVTQWSDQDEVFNTIAQSLRRVIEQLQALLHPPVPLSPLDRQNRMRLLKQMQAIWIDGLLTQSLHQAAKIELNLQERPDILANPWRLQVQELDQAPQTLPDGTSIVQVYDRANSELLILGEPGAGKTTLLLELARTLLERAKNDERLPMPIVFHLSSWAEQRQSLSTWLVEELWTKYQVPRKIGKGWVDTDQVLPLLDGLDEVTKEARSACVQQINDYYQSRLERGSSPIVVCCRSEEYTEISVRIMFQHAISILPLTDEQINTYLEQAGEQVKGLRQALNEDAELHSLARQPLMLNIFTFAYQGATAAEVPTGATREETQRTIFARYVEHMLKRRGQSKRWQPEQVIRYLTFLAKQMHQHDQIVFPVESLQPSWLLKKWRILYLWFAVLAFGLLGGLSIGSVFGLAIGLITGQTIGPAVGLTIGLAVGLIVGLVFGLIIGLDTGTVLIEAFAWSWREARSNLAIGLAGGLGIGLLFGLVGRPLLGLIIGLLFGLVLTLIFGFSLREIPERLSLSPNEGIWRTTTNALLYVLTAGLPIGLLWSLFGWLFLGPFLGPVAGLVSGLVGGLFFGPIFALALGLETIVKHFILRSVLSRQDGLPWDLVPFLDEAAERLLLRKVGGSYIFVHRLLLEYFADLVDEE